MRKSTLFDKEEQHEALQGPIQLKDPNSFEFAYQQLYWIKVLYSSWNSSLQEWKAAVEKADEFRIYDRLPDPAHPYGSLDAMLKAEIGVMEAEGSRVIDARERSRIEADQAQPSKVVGAPMGSRNALKVASEPVGDVPALETVGEINSNIVRINSAKRPGPTAKRLTARIARDRPDILERMKAKEFTSVRQAAIEAGFLKPEFSVPVESQGAGRRILNRFQGEPLLELIRILTNHAGIEVIEPTNGPARAAKDLIGRFGNEYGLAFARELWRLLGYSAPPENSDGSDCGHVD